MPSLRFIVVQISVAVAAALQCLAAPTQWAAAMLARQPALGAPLIDILGVKLYAPGKLFIWRPPSTPTRCTSLLVLERSLLSAAC